ncbi:MAG: glycogen debranching enzyme [Lachnospiraceae bacterium]|nr:glycogen debranching enzyme [Lachnospiraceae bacterium]
MIPTKKIGDYYVHQGIFEWNGATPLMDGVNFTVHTHFGTSCELLLFHNGEDEPYAVLPFPKEFQIGDVYSMMVYGLDISKFEYAYRIDGPYEPAKGHIFNKNAVLLDPYAKSVACQGVWGKKPGHYHARVVSDNFDWRNETQSAKPMSDLVIYELHVRSFTQNENSGVSHRGTFAGIQEKIPYLKELGINAVELMPVFEFDEYMNAREVDGKQLLECWGYNTVSFFAPNAEYASVDEKNFAGRELKELIRELHKNDIEVILDVVFNHTAEGNERGPFFSFKGFDNQIYYMLTPDGNYYNFSGCGNTLNCSHPIVQNLVTESLRYWTINYRVDGFRFDLATILGRNEDGSPMNNPPLLRSLAYDPVLSRVKLIAEAWDAGGLYQVGSFPASKRWAEWNGRYRDAMRGYLKGENWMGHTAMMSICGSIDLYGGFEYDNDRYAGYDSCVNFFTCHDGFTMYDLYAYNDKHNENNGWHNTDGSDDNHSWNCGAEGETSDPEVLKLRYRMIRNAVAVLMCSRGTPMFLAGDEFGNTKFGNNNSYCQDNEISWLDWSLLEKNQDLFQFFKFMIHYRREHMVIRKRLPDPVCGMARLKVHAPDAKVTEDLEYSMRTFCVSFAGYDSEKGKDDLVYLAINTYWEDVYITLPDLKQQGEWYLSADTYGDEKGRYCFHELQEKRITHGYTLRPRTVAVFTGRLF